MKKIFALIICVGALLALLCSCTQIEDIAGGLLGGGGDKPCQHVPVTDAAVAATCDKPGLTEGSHCSVCNEILVPQHPVTVPHTEVIDEAVAMTCTTDGRTTGVHCSVCGTPIIKQEIIPASHRYGEWEDVITVSCFGDGEQKRTCSICTEDTEGHVDTQTISKLEHKFIPFGESNLFACELCDARIFEGSIYAAFETQISWYEAYNLCEEMGGHLVTITSDKEQAYVTEIIKSRTYPVSLDFYYWAGGIQRDSGWTWVTGEDFEYESWSSKEPDGAKQQWLLALAASKMSSGNSHANVGEWEDVDQPHRAGFICEWEVDIDESTHYFTEWETISEVSCFADGAEFRVCSHCGLEETRVVEQLKHNFSFKEETGLTSCEHCNAVQYKGRIYKIFSDKLSWYGAHYHCEALGGHLVTITSVEEQTFIETYMRLESFSAEAWIGAYNDGEGFSWITDEEFDYTNWDAKQPDNYGGYQFFGSVNWNQFGKWHDRSPIEGKYNFICEWEAE